MKIEILYTKTFLKQFNKRITPNKNLYKKYLERVRLFQENPNNPVLRNHQLKGARQGLYSFSITGDIRVIYEFTDDRKIVVFFVEVGSHNQVY